MLRSIKSLVIPVSVLVAAATIAGCSFIDDWYGSRTYRGTFSWGFEVSDFRKCGSDKNWWVVPNDADVGAELVDTYRELRGDTMYQEVFVKVRGEVSGLGQYGHVGAYEREITIDEVLEIRQLRPGECEAHAR